MRIGKATAVATLGAALLVGTVSTPAQAATHATAVKAAPVNALANWRTVAEYFFLSSCQQSPLRPIYENAGIPTRCVGGGLTSNWQLQILVP